MKVIFTPSKSGALRQFRSEEWGVICLTAGEYEVPEEAGALLCADYPLNFKPASGGTKSGAAPTHNRAAKAPEKEKGP